MPILVGGKKVQEEMLARAHLSGNFLFPSPCTAMDRYFKHAEIYCEIRSLICTFHNVAFIPDQLLYILDPKPSKIT